jgi:hypothetical protein
MKKQILAAAVAATLAVPAMADISITGDAKFEYFHNKTKDGADKTSVNSTNTEANLYIRGKSGDTKVFLDLEIATNNAVESLHNVKVIESINTTTGVITYADDQKIGDTGDALDVENAYVTTKLGPIGVKAGNYTTGTSALLGEIENGSRAFDKFTLDYTVNGIKFYAGNTGNAGSSTEINNNMFAGVSANVEGWTLQAKKNNEDKWSLGAQGVAGPVGIRFEYANADTKKGDVDANGAEAAAVDATKDQDTGYFLGLTAKLDNINLGLTHIDMDGDGGITEDDSAIFAVENDGSGNSNTQLNADMTVDGTTYGAKIGKIGFKTANMNDRSYYQVSAKRPLASGATLWVGYTDKETSNTADKQTFEIDVSVKF